MGKENAKKPVKVKSKRSVGIIFDALQVRALEISRSDGKTEITAHAVAGLPDGIVSDGMVTNITVASTIIKEMLDQNNFSNAGWVVGGKNQNVLMRMSAFPNLTEDKLRNMIMFQAQQVMPISISELVIDYVLCDTFQEDNRDMINALLVGAKKIFVNNCFSLAKASNRVIEEIDSALLASLRAVTSNTKTEGVTLVAHIDCETVGMVICQQETILMARTISLSPESALEIKHYIAPKMMQPALEGIFTEENQTTPYWNLANQAIGDLRTSMSYFSTQRSFPIENIVITGTIPGLDGLVEAISKEFYIPIETPVLYPEMLDASMQDYACCLALAMRGLEV